MRRAKASSSIFTRDALDGESNIRMKSVGTKGGPAAHSLMCRTRLRVARSAFSAGVSCAYFGTDYWRWEVQ